jgi:hypothetical protein
MRLPAKRWRLVTKETPRAMFITHRATFPNESDEVKPALNFIDMVD